jgi:hypothetical protein
MGVVTRLGSMLLAGVMLGAMWLSQFGPAIQAGNPIWGFLPRHPAFEIEAWMPILWQLGLLCSCLALVFLGGGRLAGDSLLFGSHRNDDHDEL